MPPAVGQEVVDAVDRVRRQSREEVREVGAGIHAVRPGGFDEDEAGGDGASAPFASGKEPVLSPEEERPAGTPALQGIFARAGSPTVITQRMPTRRACI